MSANKMMVSWKTSLLALLAFAVGCNMMLIEIQMVNAKSAQSEVYAPLPQSANVYVDLRVGSSGNGSSSSPYQTVSEGVNAVADNGTVWIRRGVYAEPLTISKKLTLRADDNDPVLIAGVGPGDADGDALPDLWEVVGVDSNGDGRIDVNLPAMGADPKHKDIFVEIDYMVQPPSRPGAADGHSHEPMPSAIQLIVDSFKNAPVSNPDGRDGIHLHVDYGRNAPLTYGSAPTWGNLSRSEALGHQNFISTCNSAGSFQWNGFDAIRNTNFSSARIRVFHYSIWAHSLCTTLPGTSGISRGIGASDFIVSLGQWTNSVGNLNQQAGTFMHELGHNLELRHGGGGDTPEYKPNYLSVMNYSFQTDGLWVTSGVNRFDYSRFDLPDLRESSLDETAALGWPSNASHILGTRVRCPDGPDSGSTPDRKWIGINTIDWNCDSDTTDTNVQFDINQDGISNSVLTSFDDWAKISEAGFDSGGQIGPSGLGLGFVPVEPPSETPVDELTPDMAPSDPPPLPNQAPVAVDDTFTVAQGESTSLNVLTNDADSENDTLTITDVSTSTNGIVTTDGTLVSYTPNEGFSGIDSFTYTVSDGNGGTATAMVNLSITESEQPSMIVSVAGLNFTSTEGSNPTNQTITINNSGTGTLNWTASESIEWLTLSATSGTAPSDVVVSIDSSGLQTGDYTDEISITAGEQTEIVTVNLTINSAETPTQTLGDVNCDNRVSIADAVLIAQYLADLRSGNQGCPLPTGDALSMNLDGADVNADSRVSIADAVLIAQCLADIENVFCSGLTAVGR